MERTFQLPTNILALAEFLRILFDVTFFRPFWRIKANLELGGEHLPPNARPARLVYDRLFNRLSVEYCPKRACDQDPCMGSLWADFSAIRTRLTFDQDGDVIPLAVNLIDSSDSILDLQPHFDFLSWRVTQQGFRGLINLDNLIYRTYVPVTVQWCHLTVSDNPNQSMIKIGFNANERLDGDSIRPLIKACSNAGLQEILP